MKPIFTVKDKVILITGATGYLGSQMVQDLSEAGAIVIIISRDIQKAKKLCKKFSISIKQAFQIDLTNSKEVSKKFKKINEKFKRIDVLVNNACFAITKKYNEYSENDWHKNFDESLITVDVTTQLITPYLKKTQGRIINIASMYGIVPPNPEVYASDDKVNPLGYGVSKAALIQYTKYMAMQLAKYKITVNSISYGPFPNIEVVKDTKFLKKLAKKTMLKRIGNPNDSSSAIFFLSLDESSYITGQNLVIDGGWTVW